MKEDCIFCQIVEGKMEADIVYQDETFVAFRDINPKAPVHILIVPRKHIVSINNITEENKGLMGEMFLVAQKVAQEMGVREKGYKLVFNVGRGGGQVIDHLHLHLLGGWGSPGERDVPGLP
jgi:histidine triad (HIT) family protein